MKRTILYIVLGVVAVAVIISIVLPKKIEYGTKAEIEVPKECESEKSIISDVTFLIDNSGSMRGYVDFSGNNPLFRDATKSLLAKTGVFMGNCENILHAKTSAICNQNKYNTQQALENLSNYSAFSGPVTELDKLISSGVNLVKGDSSVCVLVSDMILSYGKSVLIEKKDKYYNLHNLAELQTSVRNQFQRLKNEGLGVMIVKYEGDFNGKYYCNYTENIEPCNFKDSLMQERPFYFVVVGKNKVVKQLCDLRCIPDGYKEVFTSVSLDDSDKKTENFTITQSPDQVQWIMGNPLPKKVEGVSNRIYTISQNKNIKESKARFNVSFDAFEIPIYVNKNLTANYDSHYLSYVDDIKNNCGFYFETVPYNDLSKVNHVEILYKSPRFVEYLGSSTKDDVKCSLSEMRGKTWGLEAVVEAMYDAYDIRKDSYNDVVKFNITLLKTK